MARLIERCWSCINIGWVYTAQDYSKSRVKIRKVLSLIIIALWKNPLGHPHKLHFKFIDNHANRPEIIYMIWPQDGLSQSGLIVVQKLEHNYLSFTLKSLKKSIDRPTQFPVTVIVVKSWWNKQSLNISCKSINQWFIENTLDKEWDTTFSDKNCCKVNTFLIHLIISFRRISYLFLQSILLDSYLSLSIVQ